MKKIFLLLVAVVLLLTAACSKNTEDSPPSVSPESSISSETVDEASDAADPLAELQAAETLWEELLPGLMVEESETMRVGDRLYNTIVSHVAIEVIEDRGSSCLVSISYPDAASLLIKAVETLPEEPEQKDVNDMYRAMIQAIETDGCERLTAEYEAAIYLDENGSPQLELNEAIAGALTGGLSAIE